MYEDFVKVIFNNWVFSCDEIVVFLLGKNWNGFVLVIVKGDGNCFYNFVLIVICGYEYYVMELWFCIVLEFVEYKNFYVD